jgi:hypothetical protein
MKRIISMMAVVAMMVLAGCDQVKPSSDAVQRQQQEALSQQGNSEVGMPSITNFAEKRMMRDILELRDKMMPTTTYTQDMNGKLHKLCDSIGYGLPGATQYTNPQRVARSSETPYQGNVTLNQADPDGLFSPSSSESTWVMCISPVTKKATPLYIEPRVIVSPFPLD